MDENKKEKLSKYMAEYREKNKEHISEILKERITCEICEKEYQKKKSNIA